LAAELYRENRLVGLEPKTGSGGATNDLLASIDGRSCQIEVKEFTSRNPGRQLMKQITDKAKKVPAKPAVPIIFHAVLRENADFETEKDDQFFDAIDELATKLPPQISAVVGGRRFVDSLGGRVKRETVKVVTNPDALTPSRLTDLEMLFPTNFERIEYPVYGIGNFFLFYNKPKEPN